MLFRVFPPAERVRASSILIIPTAFAPALGPVLGGLLVTDLSWRWVFYVNVPIGIAALVFGLLFLEDNVQAQPGRFDLTGFLLGGKWPRSVDVRRVRRTTEGLGGRAVLVATIVAGRRPADGARSGRVAQSRADGRLAGLPQPALSVGEWRDDPRIDRISRACCSWWRSSSRTGSTSRRSNRGSTPSRGGRGADRRAIREPAPLSAVRPTQDHGAPVSLSWRFRIDLSGLVGEGTSLWWARTLMFVIGLGQSCVFIPAQAASFATIAPASIGRASTLFNTARQLGGAIGVALLTTVIATVGPTRSWRDHVVANLGAYHAELRAPRASSRRSRSSSHLPSRTPTRQERWCAAAAWLVTRVPAKTAP